MLEYSEPVAKLIDEFKRLPGIGHKNAQRLAFYILRRPEAEVERFVEALREVKQKIVFCTVCNNMTDVNPCLYCTSPNRDRSIICIVEEPYNLVAVEKTRSYKGLYHILHGCLSPIRGIGPDELMLANLLPRLMPNNNEGVEVKEDYCCDQSEYRRRSDFKLHCASAQTLGRARDTNCNGNACRKRSRICGRSDDGQSDGESARNIIDSHNVTFDN